MKSSHDKKRDQESKICKTNEAAKTRLDCQAWNLKYTISIVLPVVVEIMDHTARSRSFSQRSTWRHLQLAVAANKADRPQCPCECPSSFQRHSSHLLLTASFDLCWRLRDHRRQRVKVVAKRVLRPMGLQCLLVREG